MNWYDLIEQDGRFKSDLHNAYSRYYGDLRQHPTFQRILNTPLRYSGASYRSRDGYSVAIQMDSDSMRRAGSNIGMTMFLALMEYNPTFAQELIQEMLSAAHTSMVDDQNGAITAALGFSAKETHTAPVITPTNEDYEYWYDLNDTGDSIIVRCDLWEPDSTEFITEILFEFDDEDDKQGAMDEAELLVKNLTSGKVQLSTFVPEIPVTTAIDSGTLTGSISTIKDRLAATGLGSIAGGMDYGYQSSPKLSDISNSTINWFTNDIVSAAMPSPSGVIKKVIS